MITEENFKRVLETLQFEEIKNNYYTHHQSGLAVDFDEQKLIYPEIKGFTVNERQTCNFSAPENFVVFECVHRLLQKGYPPQKIELEKRWTLGHSQKSGRADISVFLDDEKTQLFMIIECKTAGMEYKKALKILKEDGGQLFSYWQQDKSTQCLSLYASDFADGKVSYRNEIVLCKDDENLVKLAEKDGSIKLYQTAHNAEQLYEVWTETYLQSLHEGLIFGTDAVALDLNRKPLRKKDLKAFSPDDKIINRFEEILRHNAVSDKENAFNRLIALFICKLVDEEKADEQEVDFQYKVGTDTYETLQDRLQQLYQIGMEKFMKEEIFYVNNDYAESLFRDLNIDTREYAKTMLQNTIRKLKFFTNNDFSFKDVHNEELFLQNGKIVMEMVQLFEKYRISYASKHQFLGDMFEQLLNKGFKQNEGQFFTPSPITRFIWDCLPLNKIVKQLGGAYPKVIDYACGSGHFLTEAVEAINAVKPSDNNDWTRDSIFGIEKDYRLARVSQVSMFMNGAGNSNIIFGDGLDNGKGVENEAFDILVANPPYSVSAFKSHLKLKNNDLQLLGTISNNGGEIEVLFCERIAQLLKSDGVGAVILPSSILSNDSGSYIAARDLLFNKFHIRAIVNFGKNTFSAAKISTVVLFLEKISYPPQQDRLARDQAEAVFKQFPLVHEKDKAILNAYLQTIDVPSELYDKICQRILTWVELSNSDNEYLSAYFKALKKEMTLSKTEEKNNPDKVAQEALKLHKFFIAFQRMETQKIALFALIYGQKTLIISAPADNAQQKAFLGYDWSNRKGAEGIQIQHAGGKLYNDTDRFDPNTLAACVRSMFERQTTSIAGEQADYAKVVNTADIIDFQAVSFNRAIRTSVQNKMEIISQFPLERLGDVCHVLIGGTPARANNSYFTGENLWVSISEMSGNVISDTKEKITDEAIQNSNVKLIPKNTTLLSFKLSIGKTAIAGADLYTNEAIAGLIPKDKSQITDNYLFHLFNGKMIDLENVGSKVFGKSLNSRYLREEVKIPLPPLAIQTQIVEACEKIDEEYNQTQMKIEEYRAEIVKIANQSYQKFNLEKLGNVSGKPLYGANEKAIEGDPQKGYRYIRITDIKDDGSLNQDWKTAENIEEKYILKEGDFLFARSGATAGKTFLYKEKYGKALYAGYLIKFSLNIDKLLPDFLNIALKSDNYINWVNTNRTGTAQPNINAQQFSKFEIPVPDIATQKSIITKVAKLEAQITEMQQKLDGIEDAKKAVLDKYL